MESHPLPRQSEEYYLMAFPIAQATNSSCSYFSKITAFGPGAAISTTAQPLLLGGEAGYALDRLQSRVTAGHCAVQGSSINVKSPSRFDWCNYREPLIALCS
ncbi:hypothetical protein CI102_4305 [Trichoderma harzianum]|nr:hypothetical protein CI102_4305 [Trichoderma harzianum]